MKFRLHRLCPYCVDSKTAKSKVFLYYFDERAEIPTGSEGAGYGARHASELPYVFGQLTEHGRPAPTPKDEALSEIMRTYWTNFAKTGDPVLAATVDNLEQPVIALGPLKHLRVQVFVPVVALEGSEYLRIKEEPGNDPCRSRERQRTNGWEPPRRAR